MYKICFDQFNNIQNFDLFNSVNFINLFNIKEVSKDVIETEKIQSQDYLGRNLFYKINKKLNTKETVVENYDINDINEDIEYIPVTYDNPITKKVFLISEPYKFTMQDIINEKNNQLLTQYNCKKCLLYELLDNKHVINNNSNTGSNIININGEVISDEIKLSNNKKISIYYESDNDINISVSNDTKTWLDIKQNQFINFNNDNLYIKLISNCETNIYCLAILIN